MIAEEKARLAAIVERTEFRQVVVQAIKELMGCRTEARRTQQKTKRMLTKARARGRELAYTNALRKLRKIRP